MSQQKPSPTSTPPLHPPWVGPFGFLDPIRAFYYNPEKDWGPILVWFALIALVFVSMGLSAGLSSRGTEPLSTDPCNTTGVGFCNCQTSVAQLNDIPQVGIIGQTLRFDSPATQKLTVRWSVIGCKGYELGSGAKSPGSYALPNIPVDVYLNK